MRIAKRNEKQLSFPEEIGVKQRYLMMILHTSWYVSMLLEYKNAVNVGRPHYWVIIILVLSGIVRDRSMKDLGVYWNTKIFKLNGHNIIKRGLYKYYSQPNYTIVILEIFFVPFMFHLNITAITYSILNFIFLFFRIKLEYNELNTRII